MHCFRALVTLSARRDSTTPSQFDLVDLVRSLAGLLVSLSVLLELSAAQQVQKTPPHTSQRPRSLVFRPHRLDLGTRTLASLQQREGVVRLHGVNLQVLEPQRHPAPAPFAL